MRVDGISDAMAGALGIAAGAYAIAVVFNGNTGAFANKLKGEGGFLEILVALFAVNMVRSYKPARVITDPLLAMALLAALLRVAQSDRVKTALDAWLREGGTLSDFGAALIGLNPQ